MVIGVTMVNVQPGKEKEVYDQIKKIKCVKEVYHVFGQFDFVVIIHANNLSELNEAVDKIRSVNGVIRTQTVIGAEI
ncbi:MAG TPA: Lrp/AsnC family transcriptional regulator [Archaeoglobus profundus]|nr:Lrp/AsnC family transcriptional regulator [Archaeoglobus profundus]